MPIKFTRQADGSYLESGDFKVGTRTVKIYYDGVLRYGKEHDAKTTRSHMQEMMQNPQFMTAREYELREARVDSPEVVARRVVALVKARQAKGKGKTDDVLSDD